MKIINKNSMEHLQADVFRTIREYDLIVPGDKILAAVSGGADSMAMLYLLVLFAPALGCELGVAHVNHCLRGDESDADAGFVENCTISLGLPYYTVKTDVNAYRFKNHLSVEEAAREVRYDFLYRTMNGYGYSKIAVAHHSGDNAELVLMNIIRGSGLDGITGMPPNSEYTRIIRPMIKSDRQEIMAFMDRTGAEYRTDSSNNDESYLRNSIRKSLLPHLETRYNPKIRESINRLADIVASENDFIEKTAADFFNKSLEVIDKNFIGFESFLLRTSHIAISRRITRKALYYLKGNLKRITRFHIDKIIMMSESQKDAEIHLPDRIRVKKEGEKILFKLEAESLRTEQQNPVYSYQIDNLSGLPLTLEIPEAGISIRFRKMLDNEAGQFVTYSGKKIFINPERIKFPLVVRNAEKGDIFRPFGLDGSQKISRFFMNNKITVSQRKTWPVLESYGEILWIAGMRASEILRMSDGTGCYLVAEVL